MKLRILLVLETESDDLITNRERQNEFIKDDIETELLGCSYFYKTKYFSVREIKTNGKVYK